MKLSVWMLVAGLVAVVAVLAGVLVWQGGRTEDLRQRAEAERLRAEGLAVSVEVSARQLRESIADADFLREELAKAPRGTQPREVVKWRTRSVEIPSPALPCDASPFPPEHEPGPVLSPPAPAPFSIRLEGTQATMETRQGSLFVVGSVDVIRTSPPPEELVASLPWETEATEFLVSRPAAERRSGWGVGPALGLVDGEWVYGAAATGPALGGRVALQPAAWALAGEGHWTGAGAVLVTW